MAPHEERRLVVNNETAHDSGGDLKSGSSIPHIGDYLADVDALAESLRGYLVVQVVIDDAGHRRTCVYRSAGAAERAVRRARDRGRTAHVSLVQMLPVGVIVGLASGRR